MSYLTPLPRQHFVVIDAIKFVMAFMVVLAHAEVLGQNNMGLPARCLTKIIVPFFFMASSFLVGLKMRELSSNREKSAILIKRSLAFGKMLLIWEAISVALILAFGLGNATESRGLIYMFLMRGNNHLSWQIWFLYALALNFAIVALSFKFRRPRRILAVYFATVALLFIICDIFHPTSPLLLAIKDRAQYNIFPIVYIIPGLALGYYGVPRGKAVWAVTLALLAIAAFTFTELIAGFLGGLALFFISLTPSRLISPGVANILRTYSIYIYLLHMIVMYTILRLYPDVSGLWELTAATFLASLAIGELIRRGAATPRLAFLRHLAV